MSCCQYTLRHLLVLCDELMMRGAWVDACLTVAMGVEARRGTELPYWFEYGPKKDKHGQRVMDNTNDYIQIACLQQIHIDCIHL